MRKRVFSLLLSVCMVLVLFPTVSSAYGNYTVEGRTATLIANDADSLQSALNDSGVDEVVIGAAITLPHGTILDGGGKTVRVPSPYVNEDGTVNSSASNFRVFNVENGSTVSISNMTIMGGYVSSDGGGIASYGDITLENVTFTRSNRGLMEDEGKAVLKNCNFVMNIRETAGAIWCGDGAKVVLDGCSFTNNHSSGTGGGGAIGVRGGSTFLYANNTVLANNATNEIGGAINLYSGNAYLINCTFTGNATNGGVSCGGAIGNNEGNLYAANCIFVDNYASITGSSDRSDVSYYSGSGYSFLYNCLYGEKSVIITATDCKTDTGNKTAFSYVDTGVTLSSGSTSVSFIHPGLASGTNAYAKYVPVNATGPAITGGIATYFDYSDLSTVKMGYGAPESITGLGGLTAPDSSKKVTTYFEGGTRSDGVIGASAPKAAFAADDFTITNGTPESDKETNHGYISIDKSSASEGDTVTVTVNPADEYQLKSLTCTPDAPTISTIADVLATVEGFPKDIIENSTPTIPSDAWTNGTDVSAFTYKNLSLILKSSSYMYATLTTEVTFDATNKCYTANLNLGTLKFNMTDGVLTSFTYTHKEGKPEQYDGTYAPASTPSARLKPITPEKQTDGTYLFTMPAYAVTVTAEFEEVGGTPSGKTLPYSFDFESDFIAAGWTNIDADGDGQDWITATNIYGAEGWGVEGSRCAISQSYDNNLGAFNADNWLFSPAITIPEGGATVSWYEQSQDVSYPDFYEVYVSETNTSTDTSKMTKIFSGIAANPWNQRSVELEAAEYAGKTVYIAFRHLCYDCYILEIDDFAAEAVAPAHTHTVTFDANGGSVTPTSAETGTDGKLATLPTPTRSGSYSFDGWYTMKEGGTKVDTNTVFTAAATIYAHWSWSFSFADLPETGVTNITVPVGDYYTGVAAKDAFILYWDENINTDGNFILIDYFYTYNNGYHSWMITIENGVAEAVDGGFAGDLYTILDTINNLTSYDCWINGTYSAIHTVTFDANGGSVTPTSAETGTDGKLATLPTPTRSGSYSFDGWYTAAIGGTKVTVDDVYAADTTIYAHWTHVCANGHNYSYKVTTAPTTSATGILTGTCSRCSATTTVTLPKLNTTDYTYAVTKAATCTATGTGRYTWKTTTYGSFYFDVTITKIAHDYQPTVIAPTCTEGGYTTYTCACGDSYVADYVDALGHDFADGTCSRCGEDDPNYNPPTPKDPCEGYTDINRNGWYHSAADFVIERGLMGSTQTDALTFEPNTPCTRSMIVMILYNIAGNPVVTYEAKFPDVPAGKWYTNAIMWAYQNGIVSGYDNGKFGPNDKITREQMAVVLKGYADFKGIDTSKTADLSKFPDGNKATWSKPYISWAVAEGLINGKAQNGQTYLDPQGVATRAEVAALIRGFVLNILEAK